MPLWWHECEVASRIPRGSQKAPTGQRRGELIRLKVHHHTPLPPTHFLQLYLLKFTQLPNSAICRQPSVRAHKPNTHMVEVLRPQAKQWQTTPHPARGWKGSKVDPWRECSFMDIAK